MKLLGKNSNDFTIYANCRGSALLDELIKEAMERGIPIGDALDTISQMSANLMSSTIITAVEISRPGPHVVSEWLAMLFKGVTRGLGKYLKDEIKYE